jgi:ketosteroid isomerase-like protein
MRATLLTVCVLGLLSAAGARSADKADAKGKGSEELLKLEREVFVKNDAAALGRMLAEDWLVIGEDGDITDRESFLKEIRSGVLVFEKMDLDDMKVRLYGDSAVVTGRAVVKGKYKGEAFSTQSRWTDVFVKQQGRWLCVSAQLTRLAGK